LISLPVENLLKESEYNDFIVKIKDKNDLALWLRLYSHFIMTQNDKFMENMLNILNLD